MRHFQIEAVNHRSSAMGKGRAKEKPPPPDPLCPLRRQEPVCRTHGTFPPCAKSPFVIRDVAIAAVSQDPAC